MLRSGFTKRSSANGELELNTRKHSKSFDARLWAREQSSKSKEWHVANVILRSTRLQSRGPHVKCAPDSRDPPKQVHTAHFACGPRGQGIARLSTIAS
jgi:hypothetical protein